MDYQNSISKDSIPITYISTENISTIPDRSIKAEQTSFFSAGNNLFNKDATGIKLGYYLDDSGEPNSVNSAYNTTEFIFIDKVGTLYFSANGSSVSARFLCFYDVNKVKIGTGAIPINVASTALPVGAVFFRATYNVSFVNFQITIAGSFNGLYKPYEFGIKQSYIPSTISRDTIEVFLPPVICVGLGRIIELYNNQVSFCGNINNFIFVWSASTGGGTPKTIGSTYKEKFRIDTSSANFSLLGTYALSLSIYDANNNLLTTVTSSLKVVNKVLDIATPLRYLPVGDSLTNKPWLPETRLLINNTFGKNVLNFVGTIPFAPSYSYPNPELNSNEGRSGWRQDQYISAGWGGNIKIYVSGVTVAPASKKQYYFSNVGGGTSTFEVETVYNQNGQLFSAFGGTVTTIDLNVITSGNVSVVGTTTGGTATGVSGAVAGDSTLTYSKYENVGGNPFWNPNTLAVDFAYYFTKYSIAEPDAFVTMLGTNAITDTTSLVTFVNLIQTQMPNKKVFVLLPQYSGDYLLNQAKRKLFYDWFKSTCLSFASNPKVFIVPVAYTHDSAHNFGWTPEDINPRNPNFKNYMPLDIVHPQECGYFQFADSVFSTILANYNS